MNSVVVVFVVIVVSVIEVVDVVVVVVVVVVDVVKKMSFFVNFAELTTFFKRLLSVSAGLRTKRFAISTIWTDLGWCVWQRASRFSFSLKNAAA